MNRHSRYNRSPKGRVRYARYEGKKIRMRAGGIQFVVGVAPTAEDAELLRKKIREESPRGSVS